MISSAAPHTNRLARETSPYLLQHAANPVDWYPWGPEALERARQEDRPILLSIGYAACHWCHVMERESFEDPEIAALMNEHFVCIKVDREERPDLDDVYMAATLALTGSGGWPMTVFLTPEQTPFFAGTYFPPRDRPGQLGLSSLLERITDLWRADRDQLFRQAGELLDHIRQQSELAPPQSIAASCVEQAVTQLERSFDERHGGFGAAPKFPPSQALHLLLGQVQHTQSRTLWKMITRTLDGMKDGGIYDHLAGGFARYSTDARWFAPHFEKMLYDNAQLARVYLEAHQLTGSSEYERITRETLDYLMREMQDAEGGFYSATDADSEGVEGKYFTFTTQELRRILEPEETRVFAAHYGLTESGNWEGTNILHVAVTPAEVGEKLGLAEEEVRTLLSVARAKVFAARKLRPPPLLDDKILTSWNALALGCLAEAGRVLGEERYVQSAQRAATYLLTKLTDENGRLLRTARAGKAHLLAYLEDHALLADALIDLYEADGNLAWLKRSRALAQVMLSDFFDSESGAFFQTSQHHEALIVRGRDGNDGALPNANAVAARALVRLAWHFDEPQLRELAEGVVRAYGQRIERSPRAHLSFLNALDLMLEPPVELVFAPSAEKTAELQREVGRHFLPRRVIVFAENAAAASWSRGKELTDGRAALFICRNQSCELPVTSASEVTSRLAPEQSRARHERRQALRAAPLPGLATPAGTARYFSTGKFVGGAPVDPSATHTLPGSGLHVSRIGFGAYRVHAELPDHRRALALALQSGCNLIDTANTYTSGSSERAVGEALGSLVRSGEVCRDQIIVMSKLGLLQGRQSELAAAPGAVVLGPELAGSLHPDFLEQQLAQSLARLNLQALDVCFLHNPETLLLALSEEQLWQRLTEAFAWLEKQRASGRIGCYGLSCGALTNRRTANGEPAALDFDALVRVLDKHEFPGFRALGLPLNPLEPALWTSGVVSEAARRGWAVFVHRPLNALVEGELWRLADVPRDPTPRDFEALRIELGQLEAEFTTRLGSVLRHASEQNLDAAELLQWASRIGHRQTRSRELWNEFERGVFAPQVARVLGALDQAFAGKDLGRLWREFRQRYVPLLEAVVDAARQRASAESAARNAPLRTNLATSKGGEEEPHASLSQQALWALSCLPSVSSALVGMRTPSYVRDATTTLTWVTHPEPEEVFRWSRALDPPVDASVTSS